jgi:hypothetical protein
LRTAEDGARQQQHPRVVVERFPCVAPDLRHCFAKCREHLARHFEPDHMALRARLRRIVRQASRAAPAHQLLDFADRSPAGRFEPLALRLRGRNARELAHPREADSACFEFPSDLRQLFQSFGNPELLLRDSRTVAKEPLGVLLERAVAQPQVRTGTQRSEQPAPFLEVEPRSRFGEP